MARANASSLRVALESFNTRIAALLRWTSPIAARIPQQMRNEMRHYLGKFIAWEGLLRCYLRYIEAVHGDISLPDDFPCGELPVPLPQPPIAHAGGPYNGEVGQPIFISGAQTTDPDTPIASLRFRWEWGDGTETTGMGLVTTTKAYATANTWGIRLTVSDPQGLFSTATTQAVVSTQTAMFPIADAGGPYTVVNCTPPCSTPGPENILTVVSGSTWDGRWQATDILFTWNWGDSTADTSGYGVTSPSHIYSISGTIPPEGVTRTITLTIEDPQAQTSTDTATVTVTPAATNRAPVACFTGPASLTVGVLGNFSASCTTDPTGDGGCSFVNTALNFRWNWGDGSAEESGLGTTHLTRTHAWATAGTYSILLAVTEPTPCNLTNSIARNIVIGSVPVNQPPTAVLTGPTNIIEDQSYNWSGAGSSDPETAYTALSYKYTWGDGQITDWAVGNTNENHTYANQGTFPLRLDVRDPEGLTDFDTLSVIVGPVPQGFSCPSACTFIDRGGIDGGGTAWYGYCIRDNFGPLRLATDPDGAKLLGAKGEGRIKRNTTCILNYGDASVLNAINGQDHIIVDYEVKFDQGWIDPAVIGVPRVSIGGIHWLKLGGECPAACCDGSGGEVSACMRFDISCDDPGYRTFRNGHRFSVYSSNNGGIRQQEYAIQVLSTDIFAANIYYRMRWYVGLDRATGRLHGSVHYKYGTAGVVVKSFDQTHDDLGGYPGFADWRTMSGWDWGKGIGWGNVDWPSTAYGACHIKNLAFSPWTNAH